MKINWSVRLKNKTFWLFAAVILCAVFGHSDSFAFWEDCGAYSTGLMTVAAPVQSETSSAAAATQARTYIVKKGDTLWGIARRCGVTLSSLIAANPQIKNPNLIYPGNEVRLP